MPTTPPSITALPTPPDPNDRATFNTRAYPWSVAQQTLATEVGAVAANVFDNATEAASSAALAADQIPLAAAQVTLAMTQAQAAAGSALLAGAVAWVSGQTYAVGDARYSPLNLQTYRRKTAGAGTTDPSADATNWAPAIDATASLERSARTSNTALAASDKSKFIDITSGTFTQTFAAAATLGDGWFCYLKNSGAGDITLDPNGAETIDGLTSYVMYPGEVRLVQCDGVALRTVVLNSFYKTFTASATFINPPGYRIFEGLEWSAGSAGARSNTTTNDVLGGAGGGCFHFSVPSSSVAPSSIVTIGSGGVGAASGTTNGSTGGNTSIFGITVAGAVNTTNGGAVVVDGYPINGSGSLNTATGFNSASSIAGQQSLSVYGGAPSWSANAPYKSGSSLYGGAGGGAIYDTSGSLGDPGVSVFGGSGGAASLTGIAANGGIPGGGGGATGTGTSGSGGRGEVRVWGVI